MKHWNDTSITWIASNSHYERCLKFDPEWEACQKEKIIVERYPFIMALEKTTYDLPMIIMNELNPFKFLQDSWVAFIAGSIFILKNIWKCAGFSTNFMDRKIYTLKEKRNNEDYNIIQLPCGGQLDFEKVKIH